MNGGVYPRYVCNICRCHKRSNHLILAKEVDGTRQQSYLTADHGHVDDWYVECRRHSATAANCAQTATIGVARILSAGVHFILKEVGNLF